MAMQKCSMKFDKVVGSSCSMVVDTRLLSIFSEASQMDGT